MIRQQLLRCQGSPSHSLQADVTGHTMHRGGLYQYIRNIRYRGRGRRLSTIRSRLGPSLHKSGSGRAASEGCRRPRRWLPARPWPDTGARGEAAATTSWVESGEYLVEEPEHEHGSNDDGSYSFHESPLIMPGIVLGDFRARRKASRSATFSARSGGVQSGAVVGSWSKPGVESPNSTSRGGSSTPWSSSSKYD